MSLMYQKLFAWYPTVMQYADPRIENYFLMESPLSLVLIVVFYLSFVYKIGPNMMKNRPPVKLDKVIIVYNWLQIFLNGALLFSGLKELPKMNVLCSPLDLSYSPDAIRLLNLQYCYVLLKIIDLLDTVFFVLRKKQNQVTFLHVYHHTMMVISTWLCCRFFAGGQVYFLGLANLFVHVVMYFYYFLAACNYKKTIWWKKYITQLQIIQHFFIFTIFAVPFFNTKCSYPKPLLAAYLVQAALMIYLFSKFYVKAYMKNKQKSD